MVLWVDGIPKPQPRVKAYQRGARVGVYTPSTADDWKAQIITKAAEKKAFFEGPVRLTVQFYLPRPKARRKDYYCMTKPDIDNLLKAVMDALTQARVWRDDGQVAAVVASKRYESENREIGAVIKVTALEAEKNAPD